jgi:hypothetical protein
VYKNYCTKTSRDKIDRVSLAFTEKKKGNHFYVQEKGKHFFVYFDFRTTYKHNSYNRTPKKCLMLFKINSSQYYNDRHQKGKRKKTAAEENYL